VTDSEAAGPIQQPWPAIATELWEIERLRERPSNPRTHTGAQVEQVAASMREWGFTNPILVEPDGTIIAGHCRKLAAMRNQYARVPVIIARDWTEAQVRAYVIADNKLAMNAGWNEELLKAEIDALEEADFDLKLMGFSEEELDGLYPDEAPTTNPDAEDDIPALPGRPATRLGDVWLCGQHRVMCGDSREPETVKLLMAGELADCVWTDPPYNVDYESDAAGKIQNDAKPEARFAALLKRAFKSAFTAMHKGAPIYVAHADTEGLTFRREFEGAGFKMASCLVWRKNSMVLGRSDYNWQHEPILYGWKPGAAHRWYGERNKTTILEFEGDLFEQTAPDQYLIYLGETALVVTGKDIQVQRQPGTVLLEHKPQRSKEHPTMKPVALIERMLLNSTKPKDRVLDVFGGSGSTLIAAHKLGRVGYMMELDPKFVDVIVKRWQEFSGQPAIREGDKVLFSSVYGQESEANVPPGP